MQDNDEFTPGRAGLWYQDSAARRLFALGYLPWLAGLNLAWETAHVSLYTLWVEATPQYIAFSVAHCTLGDVLIGLAALMLALIAGRERSLVHWRWTRIAAITAASGVGYAIFSEWMNTELLASWTYSTSMPTLDLAGIEIGLTPLLQWLVLPPLALYFARKTPTRRIKT